MSTNSKPAGVSLDARLKQADAALARFRNETLGHFIDGRSVAGAGEVFENFSPVDQASLGKVASGTQAEVARACEAAADAFRAWKKVGGSERRRILHRIADAIEARADEIALVECMDTGQAWRFMSKAALRGAENFRFFADRAPDAGNGLSLPTDTHMNYTVRQPIGPVGVITPWNTPFMLSTWKMAPALAAGCTVVHKPAEWSPLSARLLIEIMTEAGLPAGVANLVNGIGETTGKVLTEHEAIRAVAFIGESRT
nr:aldehyde dehydrogenase family protein [Burkholderiaceae bacterium]